MNNSVDLVGIPSREAGCGTRHPVLIIGDPEKIVNIFVGMTGSPGWKRS